MVLEVATDKRSLRRIVRFVSVSVRRVSAGGARGATGEGKLKELHAAKQQEMKLSVDTVRRRPPQTLMTTTASATAMTPTIIVVAVHVVVCGVTSPAAIIVLHSGHIASTEEPVLY